jgi:hypothetical protein
VTLAYDTVDDLHSVLAAIKIPQGITFEAKVSPAAPSLKISSLWMGRCVAPPPQFLNANRPVFVSATQEGAMGPVGVGGTVLRGHQLLAFPLQ